MDKKFQLYWILIHVKCFSRGKIIHSKCFKRGQLLFSKHRIEMKAIGRPPQVVLVGELETDSVGV
jgi:hypothetical protein